MQGRPNTTTDNKFLSQGSNNNRSVEQPGRINPNAQKVINPFEFMPEFSDDAESSDHDIDKSNLDDPEERSLTNPIRAVASLNKLVKSSAPITDLKGPASTASNSESLLEPRRTGSRQVEIPIDKRSLPAQNRIPAEMVQPDSPSAPLSSSSRQFGARPQEMERPRQLAPGPVGRELSSASSSMQAVVRGSRMDEEKRGIKPEENSTDLSLLSMTYKDPLLTN